MRPWREEKFVKNGRKSFEELVKIHAENQLFWRSANGNLIILTGDDGFIFVVEKAFLAFELANYTTFCRQVQMINNHYTGFKAEVCAGVEFQFIWNEDRQQFSFEVKTSEGDSYNSVLTPSDISTLAQKFEFERPRQQLSDAGIVAYTRATDWDRISTGGNGFDFVTGVLTGESDQNVNQ